jgi:peptidyl-prolyl cis-trans isomerase-like 3
METIQFLESKSHLIYGRVIDGFDTLDAMERLEVDNKNKPIDPIKIVNIQIHANPLAT